MIDYVSASLDSIYIGITGLFKKISYDKFYNAHLYFTTNRLEENKFI